ncbi:MAG: hypothetical protein GEU83_00925 [Pseudonocardiaceae bacterium]|nr:hypothetical protein [Pseudonocardiaceae bacterium]
MRQRVLRLARNHLVERFGDDPFDGDELVLREDHMVEREVAWSVPFVQRSRFENPTLDNVLFVGPVIIPKDTRFAPSLTPSAFARVEDYIAQVCDGELGPWHRADEDPTDRTWVALGLIWTLREELCDPGIGVHSSAMYQSLDFAAYEFDKHGRDGLADLLRNAMEQRADATPQSLDAVARQVLEQLGHPAPPVPLPVDGAGTPGP